MKSSVEELRRRGFATQQDIQSNKDISLIDLLKLLHDDNAVIRTASANNLIINEKYELLIASELLNQLFVEKCLYTKIAICEKLKTGGVNTARQMVNYLGVIGDNQYRRIPNKVSQKRSYPLPRDIIARTICKMSVKVYPVLLDILHSKDNGIISEALDAVGFMTFYNKQLSNDGNAQEVFWVIEKNKNSDLIVWKAIICLSAFPSEKTRKVLESFIGRENLLGEEAKRSIKYMNSPG